MAVLPDYVSGTITVTQGDVNFTGTNTLWRTMGFREGDTVQLQGFTAIIKGTSEFGNPIDSNVAGQFVEPWPGQSGTFAYRMRFLPDGARFAGKSTNLIELLGNGVLANLAELGVEDGKTPVGNAAGQYELKPTSGFGIQDPTGSLGKLAALTLAANKILNTDASGDLTQSDITAAALVLLKLAGTASANKFPFFDTATSTALADLTSFARQLLSKANAAQMYALLGGSSGNGWERTPGGQLIQYGAEAKTTNSAGGFSVTLPTAYGAPYSYRPVIVNGNSNVGVNFSVWPEQTANAFSAVAKYADSGTPAVGILAQVNWLTIGV